MSSAGPVVLVKGTHTLEQIYFNTLLALGKAAEREAGLLTGQEMHQPIMQMMLDY